AHQPVLRPAFRLPDHHDRSLGVLNDTNATSVHDTNGRREYGRAERPCVLQCLVGVGHRHVRVPRRRDGAVLLGGSRRDPGHAFASATEAPACTVAVTSTSSSRSSSLATSACAESPGCSASSTASAVAGSRSLTATCSPVPSRSLPGTFKALRGSRTSTASSA